MLRPRHRRTVTVVLMCCACAARPCYCATVSGCAVPKDRAGGDSQRGGAPALTIRTMLSKARMGRRQSRRLPRLRWRLCCLSFGSQRRRRFGSFVCDHSTSSAGSWPCSQRCSSIHFWLLPWIQICRSAVEDVALVTKASDVPSFDKKPARAVRDNRHVLQLFQLLKPLSVGTLNMTRYFIVWAKLSYRTG